MLQTSHDVYVLVVELFHASLQTVDLHRPCSCCWLSLQHFVRHHETWLVKAGVDVDLWRKSCAPISKFAGSNATGGRGGAAAAAGAGSTEAGAAAAAAGDDDGATARKASSTRLPDGGCQMSQISSVTVAATTVNIAALRSH